MWSLGGRRRLSTDIHTDSRYYGLPVVVGVNVSMNGCSAL